MFSIEFNFSISITALIIKGLLHKISEKINFKLDILLLGEGDTFFKNRISKLNGKKSFIFS